MTIILQATLVLTSLALIVLILMQKGTGGGLSDMFGGTTSSVTGSSTAGKNIMRITTITALIWTASIVGLGLLTASY